MSTAFEIFLSVPPGLETALLSETRAAGFPDPKQVPGGVQFMGHWPDVWRANLELRGASRVLARIGDFRVFHLAQLDKRSRKFPFAEVLRTDVPMRVEVTCRRSKVYHDRAAKQRIERALVEAHGMTLSEDAALVLKVRIEDDLCTLSLDTSGEALHKRGHKEAIGKAPMRENMAALFLRMAGYDGTETVLDPMCGSGTFPMEAAEIAAGMQAGRARHFAFEELQTFDAARFAQMRRMDGRGTDLRFFGSDRNVGVIGSARENARRAGLSDLCTFDAKPVSDITPPEGATPGLVIVNPPYGTRIGNKKLLYALYGSFGAVMKERFSGWRVAVITSDASLAKSCDLPFKPTDAPVAHGGLRVTLWQTDPL